MAAAWASGGREADEGRQRQVGSRAIGTSRSSGQKDKEARREPERHEGQEVARVEELGSRALEGRERRRAGRPVGTISTVAAQSGQSRVVVALLRDGEQLELRLQEMRPGIFEVGAELAECRRLLEEHRRLMRNLARRKDAPLDGWKAKYREAEARRPAMGAELRQVYASMADNLEGCWRGLLGQLEQRLQLLEETSQFYAAVEQLRKSLERADAHVQAARAHFLAGPDGAQFAQAAAELARLNQQVTRDYLAAKTRQAQLLELIARIAAGNLGDARQELLVGGAQSLVDYLRAYLGPLERRRTQLEAVISSSSSRSTSKLGEARAPIAGQAGAAPREIANYSDLNLAEGWLQLKLEQLNSSLLSSLGSSGQDARSILDKHEQIALELAAIEGAVLKFSARSAPATKLAEGEQATEAEARTQRRLEQQRQLAGRTRQALGLLEARMSLLRRTIDFYGRAREAGADINRMMRRLQLDDSLQSVQFVADELELRDVSAVVASGATIISELQQLQLAQQQGQRPQLLGLGLATGGLRATIDQLSRELAQLKTLLHQRRLVLLNEDAGKMAQNFSAKCHQLKFWLDNQAKGFLAANSRLPFEAPALRAFCKAHEELRRAMGQKTQEVEALLRLLATLTESLEAKSATASEIQRDTDELRQDWISVTNCLERRLEFARQFLAFLLAQGELGREIDRLAKWDEQPQEATADEVEARVERALVQLGQQVAQLEQEAQRAHTALVLEARVAPNDINKQQVVAHANGALRLLSERNKTTLSRLKARGPRKWTDGPAGRAEGGAVKQQAPAAPAEGPRPAKGRRGNAGCVAPRFSRALRDLEVEPFSSVVLECELDPATMVNLAGNYTQQICVEWLLNGKRIPANVKHSTASEGRRHRLTISQFGPSCRGVYAARATNQLNGLSASTSCQLRLAGVREVEEAGAGEPVAASGGESRAGPAGLRRAAQGQPSAASPADSTTSSFSTWRPGGVHNKWQQQATRERALERIIRGVESTTSLEGAAASARNESGPGPAPASGTAQPTQLPVTQATYAGRPEVARQNGQQQQQQRQQLPRIDYIDSPGAPGSSSSVASRSISHSPFEGTPQPPVFTQALSDSLARAGSRAGLVCVVMGNPPPQVEWLHDGRPVASAKCTRNAGKPQANICKLTIETMDEQARGQYVCRATNRLGQSQTALTLAK